MKDISKGELLISYIRENLSKFGLSFVCMFVLVITLMLSGVSPYDIWYPMLINLVIIVTYAAVGFIKYSGKHRTLKKLKNSIDVMVDNLPEATTMLEQDYQGLLQELKNQKNQVINEGNRSRKDTMEYVTIWTHQIKTPLTALQLLISDMEEPDKSEMLARLFEIEQYADMMLQYLRLDSQTTDYILQRYGVKSMVNQAVKYYARIFISKGISVKINVPEDFFVVTDEKWMVFVLKQLISNAIKYTEQGSVKIYIEDGRLVIEDTGIGIAKEDLPRIFEKGYTGYNGRSDKKASGIGLYLCRQILQKLGHKVYVESEPGKGTRVKLVF